MSKREHLKFVLEGMGFRPSYDDEGDIRMRYQMKEMFFLLNEEDEDNYLCIIFPHFIDIEEGEESMALAICNKMTRELKLAKAYVEASFKTVSATCEFYYANDEALEYSIRKSLRIISLMGNQYYKNKKELT